MEGAGTGGRHCLDIRLVVIGHDLVGRHTVALDGLPKEGLGTGRIAVLAKEDIHDHTVLVNRAIEVALLSLAEEEDFIHEPALADRRSPSAYLGCELRSERLDPVEDGALRDV